MNCDLHVHSHFSDGTASPAEIVAMARKLGLSAVALTDHNTVSGLERFMRAADGKKVQAVAGMELSTVFDGKEVHMLGLFLPRDSWPLLEEKMQGIAVFSENLSANCDHLAALKETLPLEQVWLFILAPIAGAMFAGLLYKKMFETK